MILKVSSREASIKSQFSPILTNKGVFGGPSGPSREGPGVGHKIVSDTKQMTKERKKKKKNEWEKGKMYKENKFGQLIDASY